VIIEEQEEGENPHELQKKEEVVLDSVVATRCLIGSGWARPWQQKH
jgi:hypothetical protein